MNESIKTGRYQHVTNQPVGLRITQILTGYICPKTYVPGTVQSTTDQILPSRKSNLILFQGRKPIIHLNTDFMWSSSSILNKKMTKVHGN